MCAALASPKRKSTSLEQSHSRKKSKTVLDNHTKGKRSADEDTKPQRESQTQDDLVAAALKGFESDDDDEDVSGSDGEPASIENIPEAPADVRRKTKSAKKDADSPGVIYVGRVPHGFYEHQMTAYFSQFGDISNLRLSRNKKTGRSKHYAFIEFRSSEVAQIVADTMDKYLLFGHILQVRKIPESDVHPNLFKGANKRYNVIPRTMLQRRQVGLGTDRQGWERRIENEQKRRQKKEEKIKALDYEFHMPAVKKVDMVSGQDHSADSATGEQTDVPLAIENQKDQIGIDTVIPVTSIKIDPVKVSKKGRTMKTRSSSR